MLFWYELAVLYLTYYLLLQTYVSVVLRRLSRSGAGRLSRAREGENGNGLQEY